MPLTMLLFTAALGASPLGVIQDSPPPEPEPTPRPQPESEQAAPPAQAPSNDVAPDSPDWSWDDAPPDEAAALTPDQMENRLWWIMVPTAGLAVATLLATGPLTLVGAALVLATAWAGGFIFIPAALAVPWVGLLGLTTPMGLYLLVRALLVEERPDVYWGAVAGAGVGMALGAASLALAFLSPVVALLVVPRLGVPDTQTWNALFFGAIGASLVFLLAPGPLWGASTAIGTLIGAGGWPEGATGE